MSESFSEDDVRTLCFNLDIDFDELPSSLGKTGKIRELLRLTRKLGLLPQLITLCRQENPAADWPDPDTQITEALLGEEPRQRRPFEPETIMLLAGTFMMGSEGGEGVATHETPASEITLPSYHIGRRPVTNSQYHYYLQQTGQVAPPELNWENGTSPSAAQESEPVCGVTWHEALAYCHWLAEQTGERYALPSEAQWEQAAALPDNPCQMVDHIREWTTTLWGEKRRQPDARYGYPWRPDDGRDNLLANDQIRRIIRGGSPSITKRSSELPTQRGLKTNRIGFRIIINEEQP